MRLYTSYPNLIISKKTIFRLQFVSGNHLTLLVGDKYGPMVDVGGTTEEHRPTFWRVSVVIGSGTLLRVEADEYPNHWQNLKGKGWYIALSSLFGLF